MEKENEEKGIKNRKNTKTEKEKKKENKKGKKRQKGTKEETKKWTKTFAHARLSASLRAQATLVVFSWYWYPCGLKQGNQIRKTGEGEEKITAIEPIMI